MRSSVWSPPRLSNTFAFISLQISASCGPCTLLYRPGEEFANCEIHLDSFAICEFNVVEAALAHYQQEETTRSGAGTSWSRRAFGHLVPNREKSWLEKSNGSQVDIPYGGRCG